MIGQLINGPLLDYRGRGPMIILRCHDNVIGKSLYCKLRAVRDALGLQYRFEILLETTERLCLVSLSTLLEGSSRNVAVRKLKTYAVMKN